MPSISSVKIERNLNHAISPLPERQANDAIQIRIISSMQLQHWHPIKWLRSSLISLR